MGQLRQCSQSPRSAADRFGSGGDNTDVYAFVSYDAANIARAPADRRVTFILNVNPGQDPSDGPNYFNFDDDVLYTINIDNNSRRRGANDVVYEVRHDAEPAGRRDRGIDLARPYLATRTSPHWVAAGDHRPRRSWVRGADAPSSPIR
jgi:hypothetical protein